jgi:colanic acid/amylovoran biosynthesis glycosyltransferase
MMSIAYVVRSFPKETVIRDEINELRKYADVDVFTFHSKERVTLSSRKSFSKSHNPIKIVSWSLKLLKRSWKDIRFVPVALGIANEIKKNKYDHIHTWYAATNATISYMVSKESGVPFSFSAHSRDIFVKRDSTDFMKEKVRHAKFVLVPSKWHMKYMTGLYGNIKKYKIIPNSIYVNRFRNLGRKKKDQVIFVGRPVEKKGFEYLKKAMDDLGKYKLVTIFGGASSEEIASKINESRVFCIPCVVAKDGDADGLPTAMMEAMASEVPIVTTNIKALPEMISGCGIAVDPKNSKQLANAIERLMKNPKLCKKLGKNGRKKALEFYDTVKNSKKLLDLIKEPF